MAFEIGDKVLTTAGLYIGGEWRERGVKGKVVDTSTEFGGTVTVKFKGIEGHRSLRPEYLLIREKKKEAPEVKVPEVERPFAVGDAVCFKEDVVVGLTVEVTKGVYAEVVEVIPDSNLVVVDFGDGSSDLTVAEEVLEADAAEEEGDPTEEQADPDFETEESPEVQDALQLVLDRLDEIKALLTQGPRQEISVVVHPSNGLTEEEVTSTLKAQAEEQAPEPVFKKAKNVKVGDLLYTEGGAYDKVSRVNTTQGGYTSLYGAWGNEIIQVPSGRQVQVLEEVA